jgi:hypothetical protein
MVLNECDIPVTDFTAVRQKKSGFSGHRAGFRATKTKSRRLGIAILQFLTEYGLIRPFYIVDP